MTTKLHNHWVFVWQVPDHVMPHIETIRSLIKERTEQKGEIQEMNGGFEYLETIVKEATSQVLEEKIKRNQVCYSWGND